MRFKINSKVSVAARNTWVEKPTNKRQFLKQCAWGTGLVFSLKVPSSFAQDATRAAPHHFAWPKNPQTIEPLELTDKQWRQRLSVKAYRILRREDTERAGSSPLLHEKRKGDYLCAGCGLLLFTSEMKFDSGTGWPSFTRAVEAHVDTKRDFKLIYPRTEYHCKRCGGHQGHRFNDGPEPTGQRWCNNGAALVFEPET